MYVLKNKCSYCFAKLKRSMCISTVQKTRSLKDIPGPVSLPVVGTLYQYLPFIGPYKFDRLHRNGHKKLKMFGPIVREEIAPGVNVIWLFKPEDIEIMFRQEGKYPQRRSHLALEKYRLDRPNVYNTGGLLPTNGPDWFRIRSAFQKGLSSPMAVQNFLPTTDDIIGEWLQRLQVCKYPQVDFLLELSRLFLELTGVVALDLRFNSFSEEELRPFSRSSKLIDAALITNSSILKTDNGPQLWRKFETPLFKKIRKAQEYMEEVAIDLLSLKMSFFNENISKEGTLLENYLSSPELDFKDIIGMVCDFFLAGMDTTANTTSFILYELAQNRFVQSTLHQESKALLPKPDSPITKDVLREAQYAKAVLKETLRLHPVSVGIGRILCKETEFSGYTVPEGSVIVSQNQVICRLEEYFPQATEFIPERWIKTNKLYKQSHPFLLTPFGHGSRACIARRLAEQNMLMLMLKLSRNFKIRWNGNTLDSKSLLINKPDGPLVLSFEKRKF